ncbi:phospholipase A2 [Amycolatopsis lurida]|uniref:phospholipase A2 n=1 Tax=Amycolatopsis lurida TaxID=31959 RepID=UPI0037B7BFE7
MATLPLFGSTFSASAHSGDHWWPTDGCTAAPEYYFNHPCVHHDGCYAYHWADRGTCDNWFLNDMLAECRKLPFEIVGSCGGVAFTYYGAVRLFGGSFYDDSQITARISTPMA